MTAKAGVKVPSSGYAYEPNTNWPETTPLVRSVCNGSFFPSQCEGYYASVAASDLMVCPVLQMVRPEMGGFSFGWY
jgi:hypothetical protein